MFEITESELQNLKWKAWWNKIQANAFTEHGVTIAKFDHRHQLIQFRRENRYHLISAIGLWTYVHFIVKLS